MRIRILSGDDPVALPRRDFLALGGSALVVAGTGGLLATTFGFKGCSDTPKELSKRTAQIIAALTEARVVFVEVHLANVVELVDKALGIARQLKGAFDAGNNADALTYLALLLAPDGIIQSIALAVGLLQNEAQRRVVATVLIVARLALNLIAANVTEAAAGTTAKSQAQAAGKSAQVDTVEKAASGETLAYIFNLTFGVNVPAEKGKF